MNDDTPTAERAESGAPESEDTAAAGTDERERLTAELQDAQDKYLRLYAEFENYKKRVNRDKEDIIQFANERLLNDILPVIDHLEMALKHAARERNSSLGQGVENTLKDLKKTVQKYGLTEIEADGKPFDPLVHHAMAQVERDDVDENMVVEEYRKGYKLRDKVLRAAMVAVSKRPSREEKKGDTQNKDSE